MYFACTSFRLKVETLLVTSVHCRDILSILIESGVSRVEDYEWRKYLRYQVDDKLDWYIVQVSGFHYST